jgi:ABC-type transport system involved in cytochrome c biogenesis permease component
MNRHPRAETWLTRIAMWAGGFCCIGFACVIAIGVAFDLSHRYAGIMIALVVLPTIVAGFLCIFALALRKSMRAQWRFSLANLLLVMTAAAVLLALFVAMLRES